MQYKAECPIWNYQATGINWNFFNKIWDDSFVDDYFKISEGIKLNFVISIASVIEGSLKNYLISKMEFFLRRKAWLEGELTKELEDENNRENSFPTLATSKEELLIELESINSKLTNIAGEYKIQQWKKQHEFIFFGKAYKIEYKLSSNTKIPNYEYFRKYIEIIKKETWNELIYHFRLITGARLKSFTKKVDKKLMSDISMIFQFRNFIVHSNNIEIEHDTEDVTYHGAAKSLIKYIDENGFSASEDKIFFIERLIPDKLVYHFKSCLDNFLKCDFFNEIVEMASLKNQIWTESDNYIE